MALKRSHSNWTKRPTDLEKKIEPYRKYVFICEGENTENWYFSHLIKMKKELGIHPLIEIQLLEKTEGEKSCSHPKNLVAFAERQKKSLGDKYDKKHDKMVIVFDTDIYKHKPEDYENLLKGKGDYIFAITNPSFELFLLLHYENAFQKHIEPNMDKILENLKEGKRRYIDKLFSSVSGMNPKKNPKIGLFAEKIDTAIVEENHINQEIQSAPAKVTSNIGKIIKSIRDDIL